MASMKSEHETLLNQAREERTLLLKEAKETKEKIIGEAKEAAKEEANKIMQESRQQIEFQKNAAIIDVKNQIGTLVIEVAEKVYAKNWLTKNNNINTSTPLLKKLNLISSIC